MRQSLLVLLLPLWIGCVALGVRRLRVVLVGLGILAASVLTWFVPMIWLTGGLERYVAASVELADSVVMPTSIVGGAFEVTLRMSRYLLESVLVALGPLAAASLLSVWYVRRCGWTSREWFLLGVDGAAGARVHARALRAGRLRADVPPGAGDLPLARAGDGARAGDRIAATRGRAWRSRPRW